ncbi:hypothetical protein BC332_07973 [Capsicum chinense]|nr:hypothetical protein BC332_07973 [Capsicum chinense]
MTLQSTCSPTCSEGEKRFGTKAVAMARQKWYLQHKESKYSDDQFINRTSLMKEYPSIVRKIEAHHINFHFEQQAPCNLSLVREFYMIWDLKDSEVKVRGNVITFTTNTINELLGAPHVDPEPLKTMIIKPPYQHIHYFLYDTRSMARKHMMEVTRDRVCLIYSWIRDDVDMNMGAIIFSGGNNYLSPVGDRPLDISRTKGPSPHGVNLTMPECNARTDKITTRMYRLTMLQPIDNDIPTYEERRMAYSYDETEEEEQFGDGNLGDDFGDDDVDEVMSMVTFN